MKAKLLTVAALLTAAAFAFAAAPTTINDFFMPGSQPGQSGNIESPDKCDNCHGGYDQTVEPAFNWRGSMMAQAARDPLFYACLAIANQDAPESGDLCIRCHSPDGWLSGRSIPTDGSALNNNDREGVQCDFCHKLVKPTPLGVNPYPNDPDYTADTYDQDQSYLSTLSEIPPTSANGMYIVDASNAKRGPFTDAAAKHQIFYSPFHQDAALCGTCHDVSNPAFSWDETAGEYLPNDFDTPAPDFDHYTQFPIERTYSEWLMSSYNSPTGVPSDVFGGNKANVSTCQDCHMRDVTGVACNKRGAVNRDDLPLHDLTGGNTFIPLLVAELFPDEVDVAALQAGITRATAMLQSAASFQLDVTDLGGSYEALVTVTNETGHKLPSGYPEGRRIWINLTAYDNNGAVIYESGAYDFNTADLTHDADAKIYEIKPGMSQTVADALGHTAGPSFHFAINNHIYFDNRIPPRGFTNANFESIQSQPIGYSYADGQYWDETTYPIPATAARVVATLYYQTLSKEYVTFLRDENVTNHWGQTLYDLWETNGKSTPVVMATDTVDLAPMNGQAPVADFSAAPLSGAAPLAVSFTDLSANAPTAWSWDFGDGGSSTLQNPGHTYDSADVYTVSMTATNANGSDTKTVTDYITVTEPGQTATLHVDAITVTRLAANGNREYASATVRIFDETLAPFAGATVTADFSGPTTNSVSGTTDASGEVVFESKKARNAVDEWCLTVTGVSGPDAVYDPGANVVTTACESGPAPRIVSDATASSDGSVTLQQNSPNPFNPETKIGFHLAEASHVSIEIFNVNGQRVDELFSGTLASGDHSVHWNASGFASGVYIYRIVTPQVTLSRKMTVLK